MWTQLRQWPPSATTVIGLGILLGLASYALTGSVECAVALAGIFKVLCPQDAGAADQALAEVKDLAPAIEPVAGQHAAQQPEPAAPGAGPDGKLSVYAKTAPGLALGIALGTAALLGGCANPAPISASPVQSLATAAAPLPGAASAAGTVTQGILDAQYNLNQAVTVGALAADDPAPACLNQVATAMGIGTGAAAAAQFTPKISDLISAGSVGYIYLQQLQTLTGGKLSVPAGCEQLVGQIIIDAAKAGLKTAPLALPGLAPIAGAL